MKLKKIAGAALATLTLSWPLFTTAQTQSEDNYPSRPIRLVVPYAPGGTTDVLARLVAQRMAKHLGQTVIVENKPGASTIIATESVAKAAPDGYTVLLGVNTSISSNPLLFKSLPYKVEDFRPVALISKVPIVLSVSKDSPANTVSDLVTMSKSKNGGLSFATVGTGSAIHLVGELIALKTGMDITAIPYKGSGPALLAVMSNEVDLYGDALVTSIPLINDGKIKPIAISSRERSTLYPELPTFEEAGIPDGTIHVWFGMMVPSKTPDVIVNRLNTAVNEALTSEELQARFGAEGTLVEPLDPAQFQAFIDQETSAWAEVITATKIQLDR